MYAHDTTPIIKYSNSSKNQNETVHVHRDKTRHMLFSKLPSAGAYTIYKINTVASHSHSGKL